MDIQKAARELYADLRKFDFVDETSAIAWLAGKLRAVVSEHNEELEKLAQELMETETRPDIAEAIREACPK